MSDNLEGGNVETIGNWSPRQYIGLGLSVGFLGLATCFGIRSMKGVDAANTVMQMYDDSGNERLGEGELGDLLNYRGSSLTANTAIQRHDSDGDGELNLVELAHLLERGEIK